MEGRTMTTLEALKTDLPPDVDYALCDADQHYYEAPDCMTRYLAPEHHSVIKWMNIGKRQSLLIHGKQVTVVPNPTANNYHRIFLICKHIQILARKKLALVQRRGKHSDGRAA